MARKQNSRFQPYVNNTKNHVNPYDVKSDYNNNQNLVVILNDGCLQSLKPLELPNLKTIILTSPNGTVVDFYQQIESVDHVFKSHHNIIVLIHCGMTGVKFGFDSAKIKKERFIKWLLHSFKNIFHIVVSPIILPLGATNDVLVNVLAYNSWLATKYANNSVTISVLPTTRYDNEEYKPGVVPLFFLNDIGIKKYRKCLEPEIKSLLTKISVISASNKVRGNR